MAQPEKELTFQEVYAAYVDRIYRYCYRLTCGNAADAEDLAQETFVLAYRAWGQFEGRAAVLNWLMRIADNQCRKHWNRRARAQVVSLDATMDGEISQDQQTSNPVDEITIQAALLQLSEPVRHAVILVKSEGLSYREAGEVLGVPQGTVQSRVHEGLKRIRRVLLEEGGWIGLLLVVSLSRQLKAWGASVHAPASLGVGIWQTLGLAGQPPVAQIRPCEPLYRASGGRLAIAAAVLILALTVGLAPRWLNPRNRVPISPAAQMQRALERTTRIHASGRDTRFLLLRDGSAIPQVSAVEIWHEASTRTRIVRSPDPTVVDGRTRAKNWTEYRTDGDSVRVFDPGLRSGRRIAATGVQWQQQLLTAFFLPDSEAIQASRNSPENTMIVRATSGTTTKWQINVELAARQRVRHWSFIVNPVTYLPESAEFTETIQTPTAPRIQRRTQLTHFDYGSPANLQVIVSGSSR